MTNSILDEPIEAIPYYTLGLNADVREKVAELSGGTPELFYIVGDDKGTWRSSADLPKLMRRRPMYIE